MVVVGGEGAERGAHAGASQSVCTARAMRETSKPVVKLVQGDYRNPDLFPPLGIRLWLTSFQFSDTRSGIAEGEVTLKKQQKNPAPFAVEKITPMIR